MRSNQDGIYLPRRMIFIMILVFVSINIFFLLMGILIGKDDIRWREQDEQPERVEVVADPVPVTNVEQELSMFDEEEGGRREPVDVDFLDDTLKADAEAAAREEEPVVERERPPEPEPKRPARVEERRPEPVVESKPSPPPAEASRSGEPSGSGYWIQILATKDEAKAREFRDQVSGKGFPAHLFEDGGYHKIQVGPYQERDRADRVNADISRTFNLKGWVRKR